MKPTPELIETQRRMQPGFIAREGFLGDDPRPLGDVLHWEKY